MKRLLVFALLVGCSPPTPTTEVPEPVATNEAAPTPAGIDTVPVSVPDHPSTGATQKSVPEAFRGVWDANLQSCNETSDMKLTITETTVAFWESGGEVVAATPVGEHSIRLELNGNAEGEPWDPVLQLDLSPDGETLIIPNEYGEAKRVRCPTTTDR